MRFIIYVGNVQHYMSALQAHFVKLHTLYILKKYIDKTLRFNGHQVSSSKAIAKRFIQQFTTSKLGIHKSSRDTRKTVRATKRKLLINAAQFSTEEVKKAIKGCSNSKAFDPDKLSISHLKHLGPKGIEFLTTIYNSSYSGCRIPTIWKTSIVIPKPGKDISQGSSFRPISLICPAAKVMEALLLLMINAHLPPAVDQHAFRPKHATTSALLQLTTDIAIGFNQKKPPHRTVGVAVDLTAAFDTVNHTVLISKIGRSKLPEATCR